MAFAAGILLVGAAIVGIILAGSLGVGVAQAAIPTPGGGVPTPGSTSATTSPGTSSAPGSHGLVTMAELTAVGVKHGWSPAQIADWMHVVVSESNGTLTDTNPSSGAYGIAQFISGPSEYYSYGGDPNTLQGQLTAMGNYIAQRYGNPSNAWTFHQANNYY